MKSNFAFCSFGQDALFLLGGLTKATKPVCLSLHSGDVCIMYGDCRLVYHAVPRILPADQDNLKHCYNFNGDSPCHGNKTSEENDPKSPDVSEGLAARRQEVEWGLFSQYVQCTRINMNVRQVLPPGGTNIADYPQPVCPSVNCKTGKTSSVHNDTELTQRWGLYWEYLNVLLFWCCDNRHGEQFLHEYFVKKYTVIQQ